MKMNTFFDCEIFHDQIKSSKTFTFILKIRSFSDKIHHQYFFTIFYEYIYTFLEKNFYKIHKYFIYLVSVS